MKPKWKVRVLRELTTQWAVFASEEAIGGVCIEEPIGAVGMQRDRFVAFVALWTAAGPPRLNPVTEDGFETLQRAVNAIVKAKRELNDAAQTLVQA